MRMGLWALVSLNIGGYFSQGDEGAQVLLHLDEFSEAILSASTPRKLLGEQLERVSRGALQNDTLKLRLFERPDGIFDRLVELLDPPAEARVTRTARNHAAKVIEAVSMHPEAARAMVSRGYHLKLLQMLGADSTPLYVRKVLAATLCNLAAQPENAAPLGRAGAVGALHAHCERGDPRLRRQKVSVGTSRLAVAVAEADAAGGGGVTAKLAPPERALIAELALAEQQARLQPLHSARATLVESGVLLYLHTAAGGAAWGLFESLRAGSPRGMLLQNVARTALVTCFVPILLVGGAVTGYERTNRATDSVEDKFKLYFGACLALYPAQRLLAWVERFAPLWLGGHVVGFSSFFAWTLYSESDLLKSDRELLGKEDDEEQEADQGRPKKKKQKLVVLWEADGSAAGGAAAKPAGQ